MRLEKKSVPADKRTSSLTPSTASCLRERSAGSLTNRVLEIVLPRNIKDETSTSRRKKGARERCRVAVRDRPLGKTFQCSTMWSLLSVHVERHAVRIQLTESECGTVLWKTFQCATISSKWSLLSVHVQTRSPHTIQLSRIFTLARTAHNYFA